MVLQGRTTEEPRLPKISPGGDDYYDGDYDDYYDDYYDGDYDGDYNDVCDNESEQNGVSCRILDGISIYSTEQPGPQANMPIWPGRYRPNMPIWGHVGEIFQNRLIWVKYANIGRHCLNMTKEGKYRPSIPIQTGQDN